MFEPGHNAGDAGSGRLVELLDGDETIGLATEDPAQLSVPSAPKRYSLPQKWEQHKETIRQLYLEQNRTLKEVMGIMRRDYRHFGSEKQYKNRLREWNFDIKYKRHQTSRKRNPRRLGHQSTVADGGSLASSVNDHHSQVPDARSADSHPFQAANAAGTALDADPFEAPEAGGAVDQIFQALDVDSGFQALDAQDANDQHSQAADAGAPISRILRARPRQTTRSGSFLALSDTPSPWPTLLDSNVCTSMTCTKAQMDLPETYFDLVRSAVLLYQQRSRIDGDHVVSKAFGLVKPILKSGCVRALNFFWTSLVFLVQSGHAHIIVTLIKYIYNMATDLLHPEHPVVQMFKLLTRTDVLELEDLVREAWQATADAFQMQLPKLHPEYVRHQCDLIFRIHGTRNAAIAEQRLRQLLKNCEDTPQTPELSHMTVFNALGYNFMNSKDWQQALNIGLKLEERAQLAQDIDLLVYQIGGLEIQARAFNEMKLTMPAVKCLKQAMPLIGREWGNDDPWRIELMVLQQKWLRENGEIKAADDLKAEISSITERIDTV